MAAKYHFHEAHDLHYRVHFVLSCNPYLAGRVIHCKIIEQDVILIGCVKTYYQKQMAQESLRKIDGIRRIRNELDVVS